MKIFIAIIILCSGLQAMAGTTSTVACVFTTISNALVNAGEGDEINVQAGSCTWPSQVTISQGKSFAFRGAGSNLTTFISGAIATPLWVRVVSTNLFTISGFNMVGNAANSDGWIDIGENIPTKFNGYFRIHSIQMTNMQRRGITAGYGDAWGLIDHCYFVSRSGEGWESFRFGGNSYRSWTNGNHLGTTNQVVVEDCVSDNQAGDAGNGHFDAYDGAQFTIRHCKFRGPANSGAHGYDSQPTSTRIGEIYNCEFIDMDQSTVLLDYRGGVLLWFSNQVYGTVGTTEPAIRPLLKHYRACSGAYQGTFTYSGSPLTNTYSVNWTDGASVQIGSQPNYTFQATLTDVNRHVLLGATLAESITNLVACINLGAGAGTRYANATTSSADGRNADLLAIANTTTTIILTNILDGTGLHGWPSAFQAGVYTVVKYTNSPVGLYGCFSWSNFFNGTGGVLNFERAFDGDACDGANYVTSLLQDGRDYFNNRMATNYTPLVYPHPLQSLAASAPASQAARSVGGNLGVGGNLSF